MHNGKLIAPPPKEDDTVEVSLYPVDPGKKLPGTAAAYNRTDGTFVFGGQAGVGLLPGQYRVLVRYVPYDDSKGDLFGDQFNVRESKLTYTVTEEREQQIVVDVGKRTVTRVESARK